jgi:hypothetical protein
LDNLAIEQFGNWTICQLDNSIPQLLNSAIAQFPIPAAHPGGCMTPTDFEFTVTMPGDVRLIGAVRQLAAQAAGYAQLTADAAEGLAGHVERAAQATIAASRKSPGPIHLRFSGDGRGIDVVISGEPMTADTLPRSSSIGDVMIDWSHDGSRLTCHIRQPLPI